MSHFYAYMARMRNILRWGLMRNTTPENIQEHSHQTAVVAHALALINNHIFHGDVDASRVLALAVYHEAGEVITGDLPTPIKYFNDEIKTAYQAIEANAEARLVDMLPEGLREAYRPLICQAHDREYEYMKAGDRLCAYIKCVDELNSGNHEFARAKEAIKRELLASPLPEVAYFMEHFMPSFALTLDELN